MEVATNLHGLNWKPLEDTRTSTAHDKESQRHNQQIGQSDTAHLGVAYNLYPVHEYNEPAGLM